VPGYENLLYEDGAVNEAEIRFSVLRQDFRFEKESRVFLNLGACIPLALLIPAPGGTSATRSGRQTGSVCIRNPNLSTEY
jgi:hypothetical protein